MGVFQRTVRFHYLAEQYFQDANGDNNIDVVNATFNEQVAFIQDGELVMHIVTSADGMLTPFADTDWLVNGPNGTFRCTDEDFTSTYSLVPLNELNP